MTTRVIVAFFVALLLYGSIKFLPTVVERFNHSIAIAKVSV